MSRPLEQRLREVSIPEAEDAERRAWAVVRANAPAARRVHRRRRAVAFVALAVMAITAAVVTTPGAAVAEWLEHTAARALPDSTPALSTSDELPAAGRLLVDDAGRLAIERRGRTGRLPGRWSGASWSPRGRFVVVWGGSSVVALAPDGTRRWRVRTPGAVYAGARWSPDGYRIAYLAGDARLRIVAGDGTGDRGFARSRPVAPAWRPGSDHTLAYVTLAGRLEIRNVDNRRLIWRSAPTLSRRTTALTWSRDGMQAAAIAARQIRVHRLDRRRTVRLSPPPGAVYEAAAFSPRGDALAIVTRHGRQSSLTVRGRVLFTGPGFIGAPVWSPDGEWVLVRWEAAKQWVAVRAVGAPGLETLARTGEPLGWCCPPITK